MHKSILFIACLVAALFTHTSGSLQHFDGYQVIRATPSNEAQLEILRSLEAEGQYDFWAEATPNTSADIMATPSNLLALKSLLREKGIPFTIMIEDVEKIVAEQRQFSTYQHKINNGRMGWTDYQRLETVYEWLDALQTVFPDLVTLEEIGRSTEDRPLKVIKISSGDSANKTVFWIDGTIHAREWISTGVVTYIINELVTKSHLYQNLLTSLDFYIIPVVNPDGYEYTFTTNRMWRKTRSNHNSTCWGVDANRNFGHHFGGPGSSGDKCSETYRGPVAYSEPEAEAVKNYLNALNNTNKQAFITVHSYSQLWMTPWGYTQDRPEDYQDLKDLSDQAVAALKMHFGTEYQTGSASNILYESSGSSRDWAKGDGGFKYVYTIELRDTGRYGFLLPSDQILPTAVETWDGIQVVARHLLPSKN